MKRYIYLILGVYILYTYPSWGAVATSKPTSTSDDFNGYSTDATNFAQSNAHDSTVVGGRMGLSTPFYYYNFVRFPSINIAQGSTIDSAFYVTKSGCNSCTDSAVVRVAVYDADNGIQVTDTQTVRTTWASRATTIDTGWLSTVTTWALNTYYRLPFTKLHTVIQQVINRAGWTSGNALTIMTVGTASQGGNNRATRNFDNGATSADSLLIYYTAGGGGGGGGATPNTIVRSATIRSAILRAPDKNFYYDPKKETWKW